MRMRNKRFLAILLLFTFALAACSPADEIVADSNLASVETAVEISSTESSASNNAIGLEADPACLGKDIAFAPFIDQLVIYCDDAFIYIEAESLADHEMMVGITAWNQQVPIPQAFHGDNAWRIPLNPMVADDPSPTTGQGPIGVAINGVMIYNPTQQDGIYDLSRDPNLIGELDGCGGHSGRADDYHYHIAPECLLDELVDYAEGDLPIGYAMDGFPIYGVIDGLDLDECQGAYDAEGNYGYYASHAYPYVNGCFTGEVDLSLQPATHPIRPAGEPIQVLITALYQDEDGWNRLEYEYQGNLYTMNYRLDENECYEFEYVENVGADELIRTETYCGSTQNDPPPPPN